MDNITPQLSNALPDPNPWPCNDNPHNGPQSPHAIVTDGSWGANLPTWADTPPSTTGGLATNYTIGTLGPYWPSQQPIIIIISPPYGYGAFAPQVLPYYPPTGVIYTGTCSGANF